MVRRNRTPGLFAALLASVLVVGAQPAPTAAQDVEGQMKSLISQNAELYSQPVGDGLVRALTQPVADDAGALRPLRFNVAARVMAAFPPDAARSYSPILPEEVSFGGQVFEEPYVPAGDASTSPTAVARGEGLLLVPDGRFRTELETQGHDPDDFAFRLPPGLNLPAVPFALAQASLGVGAGTEVTGRFVPRIRIEEELGEFRAQGLVVKHELTHWISLPLRLAVEGGVTGFRVGEFLDARTQHYGLAVSGTQGILTVFGSAGMQRGRVDVNYDMEGPRFEGANGANVPRFPEEGTEMAFSTRVESEPRVSMGARARFYVVSLSAQFTLAEYNGTSVMLGLGLP